MSMLSSILPANGIKFTDIIEIMILSFLFYNLLLWIRNTRAWLLLRGVVVLAICFGLVYMLHMNTLIFLINRGLDVAITAIIVIFHPELRRVLESLGEKNLFSSLIPLNFEAQGKHVERYSTHTINEMVHAILEMAKVKTGALLVIERNVSLADLERTGISLDAMVSSQLLINIFEHNTPLHDGAVLIRGDRIVSATCYLPLSGNMALSKELGTRHRAGVGISEESDSLTLIVSEETGGISIAYRGILERNVTEERLRERLTEAQDKVKTTNRFDISSMWKKAEKIPAVKVAAHALKVDRIVEKMFLSKSQEVPAGDIDLAAVPVSGDQPVTGERTGNGDEEK